MNMLLKLIENSRVIMLLTHVLEYYRGKQSQWNEVNILMYRVYAMMIYYEDGIIFLSDFSFSFISISVCILTWSKQLNL